jgi:nucleotide-binding universal stress UspA family protein
MKKIIVPLDFSAASINAARYAVDMALEINAEVVLFHAVDIAILAAGVPVASDFYANMENDAEMELIEIKEELLLRVKGRVPLSINNVTGVVVSELQNFCEENPPFAVVMGAQGKSSIKRMFLGSTTAEAIKRLRCPVMVIPSDASWHGIKKIAMACDADNTRALPLFTVDWLVNTFHAQLLLFHVNRTNANDIENGINQFIIKQAVDILILVPKTRHPLAAVFHKSVTKHICWHPTIPVIALPS